MKKNKAKSSTPAIDKYQWLTDKFIALIESGINPWEREWRTNGMGAIHNFVTKESYKGKNPWVLTIDALVRGTEPYYCGRTQGFNKGWKIKKGAKAAFITYANVVVKEDAGGKESAIPFVKWYPVFNVEDWEDEDSIHKIVDEMPQQSEPLNPDSRHESIDQFIKGTGANIITQGSQPCYSPFADRVAMPRWEDFSSGSAYYATLFHELTHWTGHSTRCNRPQSGKFGTIAYAKEELIAELGSAYLCQDKGIEHRLENHAAYLDGWLKGAKEDKMFLYRSMSDAQKAVGFLTTNA